MIVRSVFEEFLNHMEYLGYSIQDEHNGVYLAKHEWLFDLFIEEKPTGIIFYTWVKGNELAKIDRPGFIECLNSLNNRAMVIRFYADAENDLIMDAWCPKFYDRDGFAAFMDLFSRDMQLLLDQDYGIEKYCG